MKGLIKALIRALMEIGQEIFDEWKMDKAYEDALRENEEYERADRKRKAEAATLDGIRRAKADHDPDPAADAEWLRNRDPKTR